MSNETGLVHSVLSSKYNGLSMTESPRLRYSAPLPGTTSYPCAKSLNMLACVEIKGGIQIPLQKRQNKS